ncbi:MULTISPECIES: DUF6361 family protein [Enterobacteriaceae]|jgi:hypothetical protein|uniref:DUF6361 family protein n=1 Tax=Enterobacteriaceae TaxID=543 RepID=UPI002946BCD2|nr:hypothetical protein [Citrobacter freundii]HBZ9063754.1 hypothetical protein [Citrobacter freundii]HBZ9261840.1 hypothetical protein [Citrobacter freundii]HBZ9378900.1 hypothetical protein [Citrobacter freundii]HBZ9642358.1 hypothetical protein [Citrobacter freundii]
MASALGWLDHDADAQAKTLDLLARFQQKESRDELGIGTIRDSFAEQLFPGTSTIQTRLRYMLFVPWMYQRLENKRIPAANFGTQADRDERALIIPLSQLEEDSAGTFGKNSREKLKRLPSSVYWSGLRRWGIREILWSQEEYHRRVDELYRSRTEFNEQKYQEKNRGDMGDTSLFKPAQSWHSSLPVPPPNFPDEITFALTRQEASFLRDRIQLSCKGSLLAWLALHSEPADISSPWEHPDYAGFPDELKEMLTHARLFSYAMHGAALLYNYLLAKERSDNNLLSQYNDNFVNWFTALPCQEIGTWSLDRMWELTAKPGYSISLKTRRFVEQWIALIRQSPETLLTSKEACALIRTREMSLKGPRSRFKNRRALELWSGNAGTLRLVYRWHNVQIILNDLAQGLRREEC